MTYTNKVTRNPDHKPQRVESEDSGKRTTPNGWGVATFAKWTLENVLVIHSGTDTF